MPLGSCTSILEQPLEGGPLPTLSAQRAEGDEVLVYIPQGAKLGVRMLLPHEICRAHGMMADELPGNEAWDSMEAWTLAKQQSKALPPRSARAALKAFFQWWSSQGSRAGGAPDEEEEQQKQEMLRWASQRRQEIEAKKGNSPGVIRAGDANHGCEPGGVVGLPPDGEQVNPEAGLGSERRAGGLPEAGGPHYVQSLQQMKEEILMHSMARGTCRSYEKGWEQWVLFCRARPRNVFLMGDDQQSKLRDEEDMLEFITLLGGTLRKAAGTVKQKMFAAQTTHPQRSPGSFSRQTKSVDGTGRPRATPRREKKFPVTPEMLLWMRSQLNPESYPNHAI
eukprot:3531769-Amphidinium_carterae.1